MSILDVVKTMEKMGIVWGARRLLLNFSTELKRWQCCLALFCLRRFSLRGPTFLEKVGQKSH